MKALDLEFLDTFSVTNGTKEIGLSYLKNSFSAADNLTFAITGGADKDLFSIDATTGVLTFNEQAFVNTALDFDRDGIYDLQITVSGSDPGDTQTANLGVEVVFDAVAPEISNLTFTHTVNDDGATVITITGTLTDDGSGMIDGQLSLYIKHELTGETIYMPGGNVVLDEDGNFSLSQTMGANAPDGLWYIYYISMEDKAGNQKVISTQQSGNSLATATLPNDLYLGAGGGSPGAEIDVTAPTIRDIEVSTSSDNGSVVLKVIGKVGNSSSDDLNYITLTFKVAGNPTAKPLYVNIWPQNVDFSTGAFETEVTLDSTHISGTYYLNTVYSYDKAGNYTRQELDF